MKSSDRKKLIILFLIEAAVLGFCLFSGLKFTGEQADVPVTKTIGVMLPVGDAGKYVLPEDYQSDNSMRTVLTLEYGKLKKGSYRGIIHYSTSGNGSQEISFNSTQNSYVKANRLYLDPHQDSVSFDVMITEPVNNFMINIINRNDDDFSLDIRFVRSRAEMRRNIFVAAVLFSVIELTFVLFKRNARAFKAGTVILIISGIAFLPYLLKGINISQDFGYHFVRIEGLVNEMRNGNFPVYMESMWIGNYGYPVSLYYSDVFLYFPAFLRLWGFSVDVSYKMFVFCCNLMTSLLAYVSFYKIFGKRRTAMLLSFVYTCAPYRLLDIYVRSAVGEYCALTFLPLVCAGFHEICMNNEKGFKSYIPSVFELAVGMSGIFLSHLLTTEMAVFLLAVVCVLLIRKVFKPARIMAFLCSVLIVLLLCLGFLVPFLDFMLHNETEISRGMENEIPAIQDYGMQPGELFMFWKDPFGSGANNGFGDRMYLSIGMTLVLTLGIATAALCMRQGGKKLLLFTGLSWFCLFLASNLFPWNWLAYHNRLGVLFAQIQFPWRFLAMSTLFAVLTLGRLCELTEKHVTELSMRITGKNSLVQDVAFLLVGFLVFIEVTVMASNYSSTGTRTELFNTNEIQVENVAPYHILRYGTEPEKYTYEVRSSGVDVNILEHKGTSWRISCKTGESGGTIRMPLNHYIGYAAVDETGSRFELFDGENKEICFEIPPNYQGTVSVFFQAPRYWYGAAAVSALCWLCLIIGWFRLKKKIPRSPRLEAEA